MIHDEDYHELLPNLQCLVRFLASNDSRDQKL
jgi:hypothetical protein